MDENEIHDTKTQPPPTTIGERLRGRLAESGKTQSWLAKKAGIGRSRVNRVLNDRVTPSADELHWLLAALEVDDPHFMDGAGVVPSELEIKELEDSRDARLRAEAKSEALEQELRDLKAHYEVVIASKEAEFDERSRIWADQKERLVKEKDATHKQIDDVNRELIRLQERLTTERQGFEAEIAKRDDDLAKVTAARAEDYRRNSWEIHQLKTLLREKDAWIAKLTNDNNGLKALAAAASGVGLMSFIGFLASQD